MQPELFPDHRPAAPRLQAFLRDVLGNGARPSAAELLRAAVLQLGGTAGDGFLDALRALAAGHGLTRAERGCIRAMLDDGSAAAALRGPVLPEAGTVSTVDALMRRSSAYRSHADFRELIGFLGGFKAYSPYNLMLVRVQDPACGPFATERDWWDKHRRRLAEDARPLLILAPRTPVLLVFGLDQTVGEPLPQHLQDFARFTGAWDGRWMDTLMENARRHGVDVAFRPLSSTYGGFATSGAAPGRKARVVVHDGLDGPSRFGVLAHELAHVLLGHLGTDADRWWPGRAGLGHAAQEIEAEAVAHIVTSRFGLHGSSAAYLSRYVADGAVPLDASIDLIAKVASKIERMAQGELPAPKPRLPGAVKARAGRAA